MKQYVFSTNINLTVQAWSEAAAWKKFQATKNKLLRQAVRDKFDIGWDDNAEIVEVLR